MATLIKHKSGIYHIVYYNCGKRIWRTLGTRDRTLAYSKFIEYEKSGIPQKQTFTSEPKNQPNCNKPHLQRTIDEFLSFVRANYTPNTYRDYRSVMHLISDYFGNNKPIAEITSRDIELYKIEKSDKMISAYTINHDIRCIKAFFNRLVLCEIVDKNPCKGIKMLRIDDTIRPYLSREDLQSILSCTEGTQIHDIIVFAVLTGLRLGEIVNLKWEDIILEKRKIIVRSNGSFRTKTGKIRTIPIGRELRKLLLNVQCKTGLLFRSGNGAQFRGEYISKQFKKAVRKCNLDSKLHFHSLRHTFGSYLVEQGVSLFHVQQLMGHSSPYVTQIYAHLGTAELMESMEKIQIGATGVAEIQEAPEAGSVVLK